MSADTPLPRRVLVELHGLGAIALTPEEAMRHIDRVEAELRDVDAALDAEQPPIGPAAFGHFSCEVCCEHIVVGRPCQVFHDNDGLVVVHAERCTEELEQLPGIHYPLYFVDYRTVDGGSVREYARPWNDAVTRSAELAQRADVYDVEYTRWNGARRG